MILGAAALLAACPLYAPQLLAFPYSVDTPIGTVRSERPLDRAMLAQAARQAQQLVAQSPLADPGESRPIFITDGGWRWLWLSASSGGAFALTRPVTKAVVVNRTDPQTGVVRNGGIVGRTRHLGPVLAHEFTHGMIRRHFGLITDRTAPQWKLEGYCDYVARESSLSDDDVRRLEQAGTAHPALPYYHGRRRVAAILAGNGGDVDALFQTEH